MILPNKTDHFAKQMFHLLSKFSAFHILPFFSVAIYIKRSLQAGEKEEEEKTSM